MKFDLKTGSANLRELKKEKQVDISQLVKCLHSDKLTKIWKHYKLKWH